MTPTDLAVNVTTYWDLTNNSTFDTIKCRTARYKKEYSYNWACSGLVNIDGKRHDGMYGMLPWKMGRPLVWDATCVDTLVPNHLPSTVTCTDAAAAARETLKRRKYSSFSKKLCFWDAWVMGTERSYIGKRHITKSYRYFTWPEGLAILCTEN